MHFRSERSSYTPIDFLEWHEGGSLSLTPKFQRRGVWTTPARSYLIDTLLLEMPVPPIYIRVIQSPDRDKVIREVIDGQQRISAILDYVGGRYALSKNVESTSSGKKFDALTQDEKDRILHYSFICEVFYGLEDKHVLSIFARLNTHSVKLNAQELRNGKYFGHFKRISYRLALDHLEFWKEHKIFTDSRIARMAEVELTSELLIAGMSGLQDKKNSINDFYEKYDEEFRTRDLVSKRFERTIDAITEACGEFLGESEFRRPPLFYSLFTAVYHRLYSLPQVELKSPSRGRLSAAESEGLAAAVRDLSEVILLARTEDDYQPPANLRAFVSSCLRQTDNIKPRETRLKHVYLRAFH